MKFLTIAALVALATEALTLTIQNHHSLGQKSELNHLNGKSNVHLDDDYFEENAN